MLSLRKTRSGTSIIEILVMMVVLLIGIMTIIRMFPGGFLILRRAESQTFAARLAQGEIERWKLRAVNLPAGILPIDTTGAVLLDMDPGPPFNHGSYTNNERILGWRRVVGEAVKIPVGEKIETANGPFYGSIYALGFSPITNAASISVGSSPLQRFVRNSDDTDDKPWEWLERTAYAIDYGNDNGEPKITFPKLSYARTYKISCAWWEKSGSDPKPRLHTCTGAEITVAADAGGWFDVPIKICVSGVYTEYPSLKDYASAMGVTTFGVDDYSDSVSRAFESLAVTTPWSTDDAYEFKVLDPVTGIIAFNPNGYNFSEETPRGVRPLIARVDYDILDPSIIREDKPVNNNPPYTLKLTLSFVTEDQTLTNTFPDEIEAFRNCKLLIVDVADGCKIPIDGDDIITPRPRPHGGRIPGKVDVDYKAGTITFLSDPVPAFDLFNAQVDKYVAGRTFRVYYRADGDWLMQVLKPYESYAWQDDAGIDYSHCYLSSDDYLYFPICDSGKSASVDFTWFGRGTDDTEDRTHAMVAQQCQISEDTRVIGNNQWCYVDLDSKLPAGVTLVGDQPVSIRGVWGTSLKVRVFWRDGPGAPWHFAEAETSLQRQAGDE